MKWNLCAIPKKAQPLIHIGILLFAFSASASVIAQADNADRTPNSTHHYGQIADTAVWPISSVGAITIALNFNHVRYCTGTLVAPKLALTAAHCLFDGQRLVNAGNVRFLAGLNKGVPAAYSVAERLVVSKDFAPGPWRRDVAATDWAIIVLRDTLSNRPISVKSVTPEQFHAVSESGSVLQIGYGTDRRYLPSIVRDCRVSEGPDDRVFIFRCLTNTGYSGAPILADIGGTISVIGIGSSGNKKERVGTACSAKQFEKAIAGLMHPD